MTRKGAFVSQLDAALRAGAAVGERFGDLVSRADGASPVQVLARVRALGMDLQPFPDQPLAREPVPELHPLDYEWYFTEECAGHLAPLVSPQGGPLLCLGAPTVAARAAARETDVVLVDRNPLVQDRLPARSNLELRLLDIDKRPLELTGFAATFFDAPWYAEETMWWLWQAVNATQSSGVVAFSLPRPGVRPSAQEDRRRVLAACATIGSYSVHERGLTYATPRFEADAFAAANVPVLRAWRRSDLVILTRSRPWPGAPPPGPPPTEEWKTWTVGSQVVKLRADPPRRALRTLVAPVPSVQGWVFPEVSRRDRRRTLVDLWTSRNRVAQVADAAAVSALLDRLAALPHVAYAQAPLSSDDAFTALARVLALEPKLAACSA